MTNAQIAAVLDEIGTLLEIRGENPFRAGAYHKGARAIEDLREEVSSLIEAGQLSDVRGIGKALAEAITTLVKTGQLPYHEELREQTPLGLLEILRLPGMGTKKVKVLYDELGIDSLERLKAACEDGRVAQLKGFGARTQEKLLQGIAFAQQAGGRLRIDQVEDLALALVEHLRECRAVRVVDVCGSLRRRKETIGSVDLLVASGAPAEAVECFAAAAGVAEVLNRGDATCQVSLQKTTRSGRRLQVRGNLRVVPEGEFPFALHASTGSAEHCAAVRARAEQLGLVLDERGLRRGKEAIDCRDEGDLYRALRLDPIPPELREHTGEVEAALEHRLPRLLEQQDIRGVFHCHTDWSDGGSTLEEMAGAASELGLEYLGIADHSQSLTVARGLTPDRVRRQQEEIDRLNQRPKGIRLFKGTECDILPDGSLDFTPDVLRTFDYVVASVHSHFGQSRQEMTARIVRAVNNPYVTMLGHATGRLLLRRPGYHVDLDTVLEAAARSGTLIEINAQPTRLDLDWIHCKRARELGVRLVINPDAHSTEELRYFRYGVDVARRGWLEKADVLNTLSAAEVATVLQKRKWD